MKHSGWLLDLGIALLVAALIVEGIAIGMGIYFGV
jgi:hypothetical protein